ncbi:YbhB/YbcL family Raf kinase inhibitor-like protein [Flavihumibacter stibioxidans]|uniref:Kinase inhibitor n=1 Tax=Flavihumibacter stibioxidans TaxID=1834163 RepID=A0ABR7M8W3_9BACT|nr:YbhB/YbcL family Raf kinase inhibitor-like protein [Flavihumibacter stibioxidans]MBC6491465.1 kinase inhibitor [Flavihumibacter stibioxidans]
MKHQLKEIDYSLMKISSSAFGQQQMIPARYACDGADINPPLEIEDIPEAAACLAIIVDDPDAPRGTWVHWVCWNIPVTHHVKEDASPGIQGRNDFGKHRYNGPCPPSGTHHYHFKLYALDQQLDLTPGSTKSALESAMAGHILGFGELIGQYKKN